MVSQFASRVAIDTQFETDIGTYYYVSVKIQSEPLVITDLFDSFNRSHCLAYSLVGLQEMNLAYRFPIIFWNTACLITDSGGAEDLEAEGNNNYDKIAIAIGKMTSSGVAVLPPNINKSSYTFTPIVEENKIFFGMRGMLNVGDDIIQDIIAKRPYSSIQDFYTRVAPKRQVMISLIKGGAFDEIIDRRKAMVWYLWETCDKKSRLTLQNMPGLLKYGLVPDSEKFTLAKRVYEFNRYLKAITKAGSKASKDSYLLDERAITFLQEIEQDALILGNRIKVKEWDKVYQGYMDTFRDWISKSKDEILKELNFRIFKEDWDKYAGEGNLSAWEMEVLCFYYHEHELKDVNKRKYGLVDFDKLPEEPEVDRVWRKGDKEIKTFKLHHICGTCIAKNKTKSTVTLLTTTGVVNVRVRKELFAIYDRQLSVRNPDGTKTVVERSWFGRGNKIIVQGIRSGDDFVAKKYASSIGHQLLRIDKILPNGDLILQEERKKGECDDKEE